MSTLGGSNRETFGLFQADSRLAGVFRPSHSKAISELWPPALCWDDALAAVLPSTPRWLQYQLEQRLLEELAPAAIVTDGELKALAFYGPTHLYVHRMSGEAPECILDLVCVGLAPALLSAACGALRDGRRSESAGILESDDGEVRKVTVTVRRLDGRGDVAVVFLVTFTEEADRVLALQESLERAREEIAQLADRLQAAEAALVG